jgi:hypothetical protein
MSTHRILKRLFTDAAIKLAFAAGMLACTLAPIMQQRTVHAHIALTQTAPEWPRVWDGKPLRPLTLSTVEQRFAARFPGSIARMTDGQQMLVLRHVTQPTRMLHPAADCYRGLGYRVESAQLEHDRDQQLRRCFIADNGSQRLRVCERIVDAQGRVFTDTSAWYWAALMQQSTGPWQAITSARPL